LCVKEREKKTLLQKNEEKIINNSTLQVSTIFYLHIFPAMEDG